jgi:chromosome segregation ATPase
MNQIETGVDRLVKLVNSEKKISVENAAKKLGISKIVVQEWVGFLEEEKLISIDYKFSKMMLIERKLTDVEVKEKKKEYSAEKDAFVRKVESSLKNLENDSLGLVKIKKEFDLLKNEIGNEIEKVQTEVKELEKYEYLKKNLDKDIEKQVIEFHTILDKSHKEMEIEQKKHQELIEELEIEKREAQVKERRLHNLEEKEDLLMKRIQDVLYTSKEIAKRVSTEKASIIDSEHKVSNLNKSVSIIENNIVQKRRSIQPLMDKAKKHEEEILILQDHILKKTREKTQAIRSQIEEGAKVTNKFQHFFDKKREVSDMIKTIEIEKKDLRESFQTLEKKAISFDLSTKSNTVRTHMKSLEKELNKVSQKKNKFQLDLEKLIKLVKG